MYNVTDKHPFLWMNDFKEIVRVLTHNKQKTSIEVVDCSKIRSCILHQRVQRYQTSGQYIKYPTKKNLSACFIIQITIFQWI